MLKLILESRAERELQGLPSPYRERMHAALARLAADPLAGKPLTGAHRGVRSLRVGDYRALYVVQASQGRVVVGHIAHRREVYR